jgi:23S rRNA (cytosine1962-C5)-methyltransferase
LSAADLCTVVNNAAQRVGVSVRILEQGHQAMDHPIHPAIPETEYIKTVFIDVR